MQKKIFHYTGILVVAAIVLTFLAMSWAMYDNTAGQLRISVKNECKYYKYFLDYVGSDFMDANAGRITDSRVTLIDPEGNVLYDTAKSADAMENHSSRPEFLQALENGESDVVRYSETLSTETFYSAMQLQSGDIIRVALTTDNVFGVMLNGAWMVLLLIEAVLILAVVTDRHVTKRLIAPINEIDLEHPLENVAYEELSPLLRRIHKQQKQISRQMDMLRRNQEEYLAITEYMKDGLIVTNQSVVLSINRSAKELFDVKAEECINHNIITVSRNQALKEALNQALRGKANESRLDIRDRVYQLLANPVRADGEVSGAVILILDITEKQAAEKMRREFSANVSHELKTPLMSISGYAEIIENNLVKPEDIPKFAGRIHSEASRLSSLVEDVIRLSRLDEGGGSLVMEEVNLLELCRKVEEQLGLRAAEQKVTMKVSGDDTAVTGVRQVLYEMIYNLCDNALKYNKPDGRVEVSARKDENGHPVLTVADTGIGIAKEEQERVFERFYRVDKSHSRETGGTGLGLSIVKHGASLHDAKVMLESTVGKGTVIRIVF